VAYRIITDAKVSIQYTVLELIIRCVIKIVETIDCRTRAGRRRYRTLFKCRPPRRSQPTNQDCTSSSQEPDPDSSRDEAARFIAKTFPERERRQFAGYLAIQVGRGGVQEISRKTGLDAKTVRKGKKEVLNQEALPEARQRRRGGGRRPKARAEPRYEPILQKLVEDEVAGDPMSDKRWTRKTLRWFKKLLGASGIDAASSTIRATMKRWGISLRKNVKSKSGKRHPERDAQFEYIKQKKREFLDAGKPVISVDAKKKELIGNFKNDGRTWRKNPHEVLDHDFPSLAEGKLVPYGIYDLARNEGHVYCGTSRDTAEFAVDALLDWWREAGRAAYPHQPELLILCDSGGSNGYRIRKWKWDLQNKLADGAGLAVTVCHYPSGASKYNPIERRLFSYISINWAGEPLTSYEKALGFIRSTRTDKGLRVDARLVDKTYEKGLRVSDEEMAALNIERHPVCPKWNYTLRPRRAGP